jgi:hypothetical protein
MRSGSDMELVSDERNTCGGPLVLKCDLDLKIAVNCRFVGTDSSPGFTAWLGLQNPKSGKHPVSLVRPINTFFFFFL